MLSITYTYTHILNAFLVHPLIEIHDGVCWVALWVKNWKWRDLNTGLSHVNQALYYIILSNQ